MGIKNREKKVKLMKRNKQTKWAPVWAVMRKYGMGKRIHPSAITTYRRSWRRIKLKIKPIKEKKKYLG